MLYAYDESCKFAEPQFVCFLQIFTNELAVQQQELEQRSKLSIDDATKATLTSSTSSVTLIADSDTDGDLTETDGETSSSKSTASDLDSGSDISNSSGRNKRSKHEKKYTLQNKKLKVIATSASKYSETLCQYLDEFPSCPKQINSTKYNAPTTALAESSNKKSMSSDFSTLDKSPDIEKSNEKEEKIFNNTNSQKSFESQPVNEDSTKMQTNIVTTTINKHNNNNIHPCSSISPEIRDFLAIISSNDVNIISNVECEELLIWFFDRFRACDSSNNLQFDDKTAISLFDGKLWIACMNMNTFEWISENIIKYSLKSYKISALKDSEHLCEVVVPVVSKSKNVLDIFDLLEKQNKNLITLKWSLKSCQPLLAEDKDFNDKAISTFCTNELFNISMDTESKNYLEQLNFSLKYCFWQIVFKFI